MRGTRALGVLRRWWWVGVVYVALGLVVSVGLAWWMGARLERAQSFDYAVEAIDRGRVPLVVETQRAFGATAVLFSGAMNRESAIGMAADWARTTNHFGGWAEERVSVPRWAWRVYDESVRGFESRPAGQADRVGVAAAGWSLPCVMSAEIWIVGALPRAVGVWTIRPGLGVPCRPLWAGLIVDVLVFASVPVMVHVGVRALVRRGRRRRGLCVWCGYSRSGIGEGAVCPECGAG